jgi:serpin B
VNSLGTTLYQSLAAGQPTTNLVLSPTSIAIALAMAREGAAGVTAAEMDQVLGINDVSALAPAMNALDQALAARTGTFPDASGSRPIEVVLRVVSALWGQEGLAWSADFLDRLAIDYGAGLQVTDFAADPEAARDTVNTWVRDETEQRVQEVLPPGAVDAATRMLLVSAVYLKAPWLTPFEAAATADTAFTRPDGTAVTVPMMRSTSQLAYAAGNGWQSVDLPYGGYALTMTVVVPDAGRLAEVEAQVSPDLVDSIVATQALRTVDLGLPRWDSESAFSLNDALSAAGMPSAFDPRAADFSSMLDEAPADRLFLAAVQHQANISVDEAGTEAAAATAVAMAGSSAPGGGPVALIADRPYLYFIRDVATGAVVFLGRVTDPSASVG